MFDTIPSFCKLKPPSRSKVEKSRAVKNRERNAINRRKAESSGNWDKSASLKAQIIQLREMKVSYRDIADMVSASVGYVRNLCWSLGMKNDILK